MNRHRINGLLLFTACVATSTLPFHLQDIYSPNKIYLIVCLAIILYNIRSLSVHPYLIAVALTSMITSIIAGLYWASLSVPLISIYFLVSLFTISALTRKCVEAFTSIFLAFIVACLIGSWIGAIYALAGLPPTFAFTNPDGREAYFYFTTATNSVVENYIRPSGVFDEPGTLSFFVCFLVFIRFLLKRNAIIDNFIVLAGLITLSVAHLVFAALFFAARLRDTRSFVISILLALVISQSSVIFELFDNRLFNRFEIVDGKFSGDSRSQRFENAMFYLSTETFVWGLDPVCAAGTGDCMTRYMQFGENPLTLLILYGFIIAWPYYFYLSVWISLLVKERQLMFLGIVAVLLQRPYSMGFGYALLCTIALFLSIKAIQSKHTPVQTHNQ